MGRFSKKAFGRFGQKDLTLTGDEGRDVLIGRGGDDTLSGLGGRDVLFGGKGNDVLDGGDGNDVLIGGTSRSGSDDDILTGGAGNDLVLGGHGDDEAIYVMAGNLGARDRYMGGQGTDTLTLVLTGDEWRQADVKADIAAFLAMLETTVSGKQPWEGHHRGYGGEADTFTFSAFDLKAEGFENLKVIVDGEELDPADEPVIAKDDTVSLGEDAGSVVFGSVLGNDQIPDRVSGLELVSGPARGVLAFNTDDGTFSFDPAGAFEHLAKDETETVSFAYGVTDADGDRDEAVVTITVTGSNDAPTVTGLTTAASVGEDAAGIGLGRMRDLIDDIDSDDDAASLSYGFASQPEAGSVRFVGTQGELQFLPGDDFHDLAEGESRDVSFSVLVRDRHGAETVEQITVRVTGTNDAPTLGASALAADEDGSGVGLDLATLADDLDSDDDAASLTYRIVTGPTEGAATLTGSTLSFDPGAGFQDLAEGATRQVVVSVEAEDRHGATAQADVTVTVTGANDAPVTQALSLSLAEDAAATVLSASYTDADSTDLHSVALDTSGTLGQVINNADGTFSYDPNGAFDGLSDGETATDRFTYTVDDGKGGSSTSAVTVTITGKDNVITGTPANDLTLTGTQGRDTIYGLAGDDRLYGLGGDDTLIGGTGSDRLFGGDGDDLLYHDSNLDGGAGNDTATLDGLFHASGYGVDLSAGTVVRDKIAVATYVSIENVIGSAGSDEITGTTGDNRLDGADGDDVIAAGAGDDHLLGGAGDDTLAGQDGDDVLEGSNGADELFGGWGNDDLSGGAGADRLHAGAGADRLTGGGGADTFVLTGGWNTITDFDAALDRLDFAANTDFVSLAELQAAVNLSTVGGTVRIGLSSVGGFAFENASFTAADIWSHITAANTVFDVARIETVDAGTAPENGQVVTIDLLDVPINPESGAGVSASAISVTDSTGAAVGFTDNGDGTISIDTAAFGGLTQGETLGLTVDYTVRNGGQVLGTNTATLTLEGQSTAPGFDPTAADDAALAEAVGRFTLPTDADFAGPGDHQIVGFLSRTANQSGSVPLGTIEDLFDDPDSALGPVAIGAVYSIDLSGATPVWVDETGSVPVSLSQSGGVYQVSGSGSAGLGYYMVELVTEDSATPGLMSEPAYVFFNVSAQKGSLNDSSNTWVGTAYDDYVDGKGSNDQLNGGGGYDILIGGKGADSLFGADGNDALSGGGGSDLLLGGDGDDALNGGDSTDALYGGDGIDSLIGENGADTLDGGAGADTMLGGDGNDMLSGSADIGEILNGGADVDTADWSQTSADWVIDLAAGTAHIGGTLFADVVSIENATGGSGDDMITGTSGGTTLRGGSGNDTLVGGGGIDRLYGERGDDTLVGSLNAGETLDGGGGSDTVNWDVSAVNWTIDLGAGTAKVGGTTYATLVSIENVALGNLDDTIIGDAADNVLDGGNGADALSGGDGDDTLVGSAHIGEVLDGGAGTDTASWVGSGAAWAVNLSTGEAIVRGTGTTYATLTDIENVQTGSLNDAIVGSAGDNVLDGGAGANQIRGLDGNDRLFASTDSVQLLIGDAGEDTVDLSRIAGATTVALADGSADGRIIAGGTTLAALRTLENVIGGEGGDTISGNSDANALRGGGGNDSLTGNGGADAFVFDAGDGTDTVTDFSLVEGDRLYISTALADGETTGADLLARFASTAAGRIDLTFDDGTIVKLNGLGAGDLAALSGQIVIDEYFA